MVGSFAQSKEAAIVYLAVYSVFVPIFQIHHLTLAMLLLTCVQMSLFDAFGLLSSDAGERETFKNMLALEVRRDLRRISDGSQTDLRRISD